MNQAFTCKIDEGANLQRIDNFLFKKLKNVPKSRIYSMIRKGEVRINSRRINSTYKLQLGDMVRIPPVWSENLTSKGSPSYESIHLLKNNILYENDKIFIINKPSGIASHGGSGISFGVIEILRAAYPKLKELELVHRLDRDTSGCMIIAKKRSALRVLHELIRNNQIRKRYLVLVRGKWDGGKRLVEVPLNKNILSGGERIVKVCANGKDSKTLFIPKKIFANASLLEVEIYTGRMHQIRVASAHIGFPVAGDEKYGDKNFNQDMKELGLKRLFLHAWQVGFCLADNAPIKISCDLDEKLNSVLEKLGNNILS